MDSPGCTQGTPSSTCTPEASHFPCGTQEAKTENLSTVEEKKNLCVGVTFELNKHRVGRLNIFSSG